MFQNRIILKIKGKNIERFLKRLNSLKIDIFDLKYIKYNEVIIEIKKEDKEQVEEVKTIYEIDEIDIKGLDKFKNKLKKNTLLLIFAFISVFVYFLLCNTIFEVEVIHNNENLRQIILKELENNNIKKYKFKKNYNQLQKIKEKIKENYKDQIEWLEISDVGVKYRVKVEERIINKQKESLPNRDIIAKKDALIIKVETISGVIQKNKNDYVHKGDTIISGTIDLNGEIKNQIPAKGKVFGEVWYRATIEYPLKYKEEIMTNQRRKVLVIHFLNYELELSFKHFKTKKTKSIKIFKNNILPIYFSLDEQIKTKEKQENLTKEQAIDKAMNKLVDNFSSKLSKEEYIISTKKLKVEQNNSRIVLEAFLSVCEDITDYKEIINEDLIEN